MDVSSTETGEVYGLPQVGLAGPGPIGRSYKPFPFFFFFAGFLFFYLLLIWKILKIQMSIKPSELTVATLDPSKATQKSFSIFGFIFLFLGI